MAVRLWSKGEHARPAAVLASPRSARPTWPGWPWSWPSWGTDPATSPFLDPPPARALAEARALLAELGAVDADGDAR